MSGRFPAASLADPAQRRAAIAHFREHGFVVLTGVLDDDELADLRGETAAQIAAGPAREPRTDFVVSPPDAALPDRYYRMQNLPGKELRSAAMLHAYAHPVLLTLLEELLGPAFTTYGSAMVWKGEDGGQAIPVHRDTWLDRRGFHADHLNLNVDVYLDQATPETGCLKVLPGSHRIDDARAAVSRQFDNPLVDVPMEPGDVLFHDTYVLHGSLPTPPGSPLRRVLYYSFQDADWMAREGVLPDMEAPRWWIGQHLRLLQHAIDERASARPDEPAYRRRLPDEWASLQDRTELVIRPVRGGLPWELDSPTTRPATAGV